VFSGVNILNTLFFYMENYENKADFDLRIISSNDRNKLEIINTRYGDIIDYFINCFRTLKIHL